MTVQLPIEQVQFDRAGRHLTAYLAGEIDAAETPEIEKQVLAEHMVDDEQVWLDLSAVTFCDSSGLGMMLRLHQAVEADGAAFALYDPSPQVRQLLELTGASDTLKVRTS